jgi:hypothetical protein
VLRLYFSHSFILFVFLVLEIKKFRVTFLVGDK